MNGLLKDMVDYVDLSDRLIGFLSKQASSKPVFTDEALHKTAEDLASSRYIREEDRAEMVDIMRNNPDMVLASLSKLAGELAGSRRAAAFSLGKPAGGAAAPTAQRESDRVLYEKLGLA